MTLSLFPPSIGIKDIKGLPLGGENLVSFSGINVDIPLSSLFSGERKINLTIEKPLIEINEKFSGFGRPGMGSGSKFSINRVTMKNGELRYSTNGFNLTLLQFNVSSYLKGDRISLKIISPHMKIVFPFSKKEVKLEGDLEGEFVNKKDVLKINSFRWGTIDFVVTGNGNIYKSGNLAIHAFFNGNPVNLLHPLLSTLSPDGDMEGNANIVRDPEGRFLVNGSFSGNDVGFNNEMFTKFRGIGRWNNRTGRIYLDSSLLSDGMESSLVVDSMKGLTKISAGNVKTSKVSKAIEIYEDIPMGGIIEKCEVELQAGRIQGNVFIKNDKSSENEFDAGGNFDFDYHTREKWIRFRTDDAVTEFGALRFLKGYIDIKRKVIDIDMEGILKESSGAGKYLKAYADLDLDEWDLRGGEGELRVNVQKEGKRSRIESMINVRNMTSNGVPIRNMKADVLSVNNDTQVAMDFNDRDLTGTAMLKTRKGTIDIHFKDIRGETQKIFNILKIDLNLKGKIKGEFFYHSGAGDPYPEIDGKYTAEEIDFYDFIFKDVSGGISVRDYVFLKDLSYLYHGGRGKSDLLINFNNDSYEVSGEIRSVDLGSFIPSFRGRGDLFFSGKGGFKVDLIKFSYDFPEISFYSGRHFAVKGAGHIETDFSDYLIRTSGNLIKNGINSPFTFDLGFEKSRYLGHFDLGLKDINVIMPWHNNSGSMQLKGEITSDREDRIHVQGVADLEGKFISFPGFPHTLDDFKGSIFFSDLDFTIRSFSGKMGGGDVSGNGMLKIADNEIKDLQVNAAGKNMFLFPMDRANFRMNANLDLRKKKDKFILGGTVNFLSALWEREVDEGISFYAETGTDEREKSSFLDNLEFDISMKGREDINVRNSFIRGLAEVDLELTGNSDFPILSGSVNSREGSLLISGRDFKLVRSKIIFNNKVRIDPIVNLEAETFIKNYRIKFQISGLSSNLKPEFTSSPPLPPQDIIALISLGELFQRPSSTNISSEVGTTGLVTSALTDQIQRRLKKLLGIDMLKLDPDPMRSSLEGASRLTIGKSISKEFLVVYSTDISKTTRDVYYFQYEITPTISLIGKRNEEGLLSLDIRFRKRY